MCQPLHSLYRKFGSRLSVTKDTLLVVSPQTVATFCNFPRYRQRYVINSLRGDAVPANVFSPDPGLTSWAILCRPFALVFTGPVRACYQIFHIHNVLPSFRHVARQKSIAVTCYTGSVSGATSSMLPCCSRNTRWQRRANAKLWVAMREVS